MREWITNAQWKRLKEVGNLYEDRGDEKGAGSFDLSGLSSSDPNYCGGSQWSASMVPVPYHSFDYARGYYYVYSGDGMTPFEAVANLIRRVKEQEWDTRILVDHGKEIERDSWGGKLKGR